jgi:hypothetical protein
MNQLIPQDVSKVYSHPIYQPGYQRRSCPFCNQVQPLPPNTGHCDSCHRNYDYPLIYPMTGNSAMLGFKQICSFCLETH